MEYSPSLIAKALLFQKLHSSPGIFVIGNAWDAGTAMLLESVGFPAIATTSAGLAFSLGKSDGQALLTLSDTIENAKNILGAISVPVSVDLENGYGNSPEECAHAISNAIKLGVSGASIEDATGNHHKPIYDFDYAVERVKAAVAVSKSAPYPFTFTARAENLLYGQNNLADTIKRLVAFSEAGADVLFAPGLKTLPEIEAVVRAVTPKPVNVLMGGVGMNFSLKILEEIGVKRISMGSSLIRATYAALFKSAEEIIQNGTFNYGNDAKTYSEINKLFEE